MFTMWSYKPPEHSPFGSLFQYSLKKKTKNMGPYFLNSLRMFAACLLTFALIFCMRCDVRKKFFFHSFQVNGNIRLLRLEPYNPRMLQIYAAKITFDPKYHNEETVRRYGLCHRENVRRHTVPTNTHVYPRHRPPCTDLSTSVLV